MHRPYGGADAAQVVGRGPGSCRRTARAAAVPVLAAAVLAGVTAPAAADDLPHPATATTLGVARAGSGSHDPGTVVVRFRDPAPDPGQQEVVHDAGGQLSAAVGASGWRRVDTRGRDPRQVRAELARDPSVEAVELDAVRSVAATPDDTFFPRQTGLAAMRVPAAWDVTTGSAATVIAVLDTGVQADHPDLAGRVLPGTDIVNRDDDASDDNGHGTGVAGAAAAVAGNGRGVAGVDWQARVLPVKVLGADGQGRDSDIAEGIRWAADQGASVVNLSLGGVDRSTVLADAVAYAISRGALVVAAAGNTGRRESSYPAALPGVLAVTATDDSGVPASFSTTGDWVDVAAPGLRVATTGLTRQSPYVTMTGTSFASPLVAGVVGLVRAQHPTWDPQRVHDWIRATARDVATPGFDAWTGAGLVDAHRAVSAPAGETIPQRYEALGGPTSALGKSLTGQLRAPDGVGRFAHYENGSIYWTPATGAHEVLGAIRGRWAQLGWELSPLGYPVTGELPTPDGRGRFTHFQHGSIYWTPATGAQEVYGAIRDRWSALGWEAGPLGFPVTGEHATPDRRGRFTHFENGSVYWTERTGAHAVYGAIRARWASLGWEASRLGYPTSSEYDVAGGRAGDFERGRITWDRATGAVTVTVR